MTNIESCNHLINGEIVQSSDFQAVVNPATEETIAEMGIATTAEVDAAVSAAASAQKDWAALSPVERGEYLKKVAELIRRDEQSLARIISTEQGKVAALATAEVQFCAGYFDYIAEWARRIEGDVITSDDPKEHIFLRYVPIGVVAGILPWNFPFFLLARKIAPALLTGNTIVVKPSEETPMNAAAFSSLILEAGIPSGVVNLIYGTGAGAGDALASHPGVGLVTFTGSVGTGKKIMKAAAENVTKVNLELGGKAPVIVLDDASLDLAVESIVASRVINSGQVCNCAERVYVHEKIEAEFTDKLTKALSAVTYGDPVKALDEGRELDMGPLVNGLAVEKVAALVSEARDDGAELVTGGETNGNGTGYFYPPTLLTNCNDSMRIMRDETFGPVLPIQTISGLDEGIALANDSTMGLTSSIFTQNLTSALRACRELEFGETYVNREHMEAFQGFHAGVKQSGIGGADGKLGLYEFMNTHVSYIREQ